MINFSEARSASVTRSMSPLFDTWRALPSRSARMRPASRAVWTAKFSKLSLSFLLGLERRKDSAKAFDPRLGRSPRQARHCAFHQTSLIGDSLAFGVRRPGRQKAGGREAGGRNRRQKQTIR